VTRVARRSIERGNIPEPTFYEVIYTYLERPLSEQLGRFCLRRGSSRLLNDQVVGGAFNQSRSSRCAIFIA
jgi:hypothetical protein